MKKLVVGACLVASLTLPAPGRTATAALELRALPMHFELRLEGPSETCGTQCRTWVNATGAITAESARDFEAFAKNNNIRGATLVLDSDRCALLANSVLVGPGHSTVTVTPVPFSSSCNASDKDNT